MQQLTKLRRLRYFTLGLFGIATIILVYGIAFGPQGHSRAAFTLEGHPVWDAGSRIESVMPPVGRDVPLFVGPSLEVEGDLGQGNVLALEVLRELASRHDEVMKDNNISRHFVDQYNWMVQRPVRGPWGMAETVRLIMNQQSPLSQQLEWDGPDFDSATNDDLTSLLSKLFSIESSEGQRPYANFVSGLKQLSDGTWYASAFYILGTGNTATLYGPTGEYSKAPGGDKPFFELWETAIDQIYAAPMIDTGEAVHTWSFLALDSEIESQVQQSLPLVGVSFLLMIVVFIIFFRDWRDVLTAAMGLGLLMVWMFGTQAWLGYPETQISSMLPILLLALGIDFSFHTLHRWRRLVTKSTESELVRLENCWETIRQLRPALGLATVTTMIAFGTAAFSQIPDLAEWGRLAVVYILEGYLLLGVFTVVMRSGMRIGHPDPQRWLARRMHMFGGLQVRRPWPFVVTLLVITAAALVVGQPDTDFDVHDYLDSDSRMVRSIDIHHLLFDESNKGEPGTILIEAESGGGLATFDQFEALDRLMNEIRRRNWTYGDATVIDMVRWQMRLVASGGEGFTPTQIDTVTALPIDDLELREVLKDIHARGAHDPLNPRAFVSARTVKSVANIDPISGNISMLTLPIKIERAEDWVWMAEFEKELNEVVAQYVDPSLNIKATLTGNSFRRFVYVSAMTESFQSSIYIAIIACFIVLLIVLRDLRLSVLTILPVVAVSIWLNAGMNLFGASLNLVTLQVASLAIGLGLDFAIHVTQGIREHRLRYPSDGLELWIRKMMGHTGVALFASGITDILGFSILMLSIMPMFTMFSKVMIAMVILALAACLLCLPALIALFGKFELSNRHRPSIHTVKS